MTHLTFGQLLRHLRKRAGMSQGGLAAAAGYSTSYVSALESGRRRPDAGTIAAHFAPALNPAGEPHLVAQLVELAAQIDGSQISAANPPCNAAKGAASGERTYAELPQMPVKLLGRAAELDWICQRVMDHPGRLLTLTGPPGIGKSSLALAAAHVLAPLLADGVSVVWLAALESSELVAPAIANALGIVENSQPPAARLVAALRRKQMLLVLDNFEQVTAAAPLVALLLAECPALRMLVTSRERLRLRAEQGYPIRPLADAPAAALFLERARAHDPAYGLTPAQQANVAEICRRLDHLPLAIELIAAHAVLLTPAALLERLSDQRLDLLDGGAVDLPADQRTLTAALHRSYSLLEPEEQQLFRMLAIFVGSATVAAVEGLGYDLRTLQALVNKSLVRIESGEGEQRAALLETVREYALRRLAASGATNVTQQYHLTWFVALAEQAEPMLQSRAQTTWLRRLEADLYNFYAALHFAVDAGRIGDAVRLCTALRHFWVARNHLDESQRWLGAIHAAADSAGLDDALWVRLLNSEGTLAFYQGDFAAALASFAAALTYATAIGDRRGMAYALDGLSAEATNRGEFQAAYDLASRSLVHSLAIGDHWLAGITLMSLGEIARLEDDYAVATQRYSESLAQLQRAGDPYFIAVAHINLGQVYLHQGDRAGAAALLRQSLAAGIEAAAVQVVAPALEKLAGILATQADTHAASLFGLAQGLRQASGVAVQPVDQADHDQLAARLQPLLQQTTYVEAYALGERMDWPAIRVTVGALF